MKRQRTIRLLAAVAMPAMLMNGQVAWAQQRPAPAPPAQQAPAPQPAAPPPSSTQDEFGVIGQGAAFVTPFPEGDTYKLTVYGDSFAEGLLSGLIDALANEPRVVIQRKHKAFGSLIKPEHDAELAAEEANREQVHIAVVMLGAYDRDRIRIGNGRPMAVGSDDWQAEYSRRFDRLLKSLKRRQMAIYVLGQPPVRAGNAQVEMINEIMRERTKANGAKFIDIVEGFVDDNNAYSQFGPDLSGNRQKLREQDGLLFTSIGNRKLAHFVEREIRRDVAKARSERNVPLAGADTEQKRINPSKAGNAANKNAAPKDAVRGAAASGKSITAPQNANQPQTIPAAPGDTTGDQKADHSRISLRTMSANGREEITAIDIVRPAIPAAVVNLVTRREVTEKITQPGEAIVEESGGLTLVGSIAGLGDGGGASEKGKRVQRSGSSPFYAVMVKGERLPPKPGRIDDHKWPRAHLEEAPKAGVQPAKQPGPAPAPQRQAPPPTTPPKSGGRG